MTLPTTGRETATRRPLRLGNQQLMYPVNTPTPRLRSGTGKASPETRVTMWCAITAGTQTAAHCETGSERSGRGKRARLDLDHI